MADTKISALAAGTPAALNDQLPIARAGANKALTVQDVLTALSLLAAGAPGQPGDLLLATRAGVAESLKIDDILSLAPKRNYLDNGGFEINQRGVASYALTNALAYGGVDRWAFKMAGTAQGAAVQQVGTGFTGCPFRLRLARTAASAQVGVLSATQLIETIDATRLAGKAVTLFWRALAGANLSSAGGVMGVKIDYGTGGDQGMASFDAGTWTGQANLVNNTSALTGAAATYSRTVNVPATATEIAVTFNFTPTGVAGADDSIVVTDAWLVEGTNPPNNYGQDPFAVQMLRCQRFLPVLSAALGTERIDGSALSTTSSVPQVRFHVRARRAVTSIQVSALADFTVFAWKNSGNVAPTAIALNSGAAGMATLNITTTAGAPTLAAGDPMSLVSANANAFILFLGAEL